MVMNETENPSTAELHWKARALQRIASSYVVGLHSGEITSFLFLFQTRSPFTIMAHKEKGIVCPCAIQESIWQSWAFWCPASLSVSYGQAAQLLQHPVDIELFPVPTSVQSLGKGEVKASAMPMLDSVQFSVWDRVI